jgi:endonuclease YncB( thermonuclease family)
LRRHLGRVWRSPRFPIVLLMVGFAADAAFAQGNATPPPACGAETIGTGSVRRVLDGRTIQLDVGQLVRLAAIEVPAPLEPRETDPQTKPAAAAKAALTTLLAGRTVILKKLGADTDRYGRIVAHVFIEGQDRSVQQEMLAQGFARVASDVGTPACAAILLASEQIARVGQLGLWADSAYAIQRAENPAKLLAERGRFTLVEGKVISVRESKGTIYVNFGRRWSEDFTVTVAKRNESVFANAGLALKKLQGRNVRVRGFVEQRGGPWIEATRPEQIELAENK